jgi:hypothetical protein
MSSIRPPKDARRVSGVDPWKELHKHVNELYWGDRERDGPPAAKPTAYRGVVIVGCVIAQNPELGGEFMLKTGGSWTWDDKEPEVARALAEQLRAAADRLEREAGS